MNWNKLFANIVIQLLVILPIQISLAFAAPPVISDVSITMFSDREAEVNFTTDQITDTRVNYGFDETLGMLKKSIALAVNHSIIIDFPQPGSLYHIKISAQNDLGETGESDIYTAESYETNTIFNINLKKLKEEPIDTVIIEWETLAKSDSVLQYGSSPDSLDKEITDANKVKNHSIILSGLEKGKEYFYRAKSSYVSSSVSSFIAPVDITPPVVTYTKPKDFLNNNTINIKGTIDENATIEIRSNVYPLMINERDEFKAKQEAGDFEFTADLFEGVNKIELKATDDHGNSYIDEFNVTVDSRAPQIELLNFSQFAPFKDYDISIRTDEEAKISVKLNNAEVASSTKFTDSLNKTLNIVEEENVVEVIAEDSAGNSVSVIKNVVKVAEPYIEIIRPDVTDKKVVVKHGKNSYGVATSDRDFTVSGKTTPGTNVLIWKIQSFGNMPEPTLKNIKSYNISPTYNISSDEKGIFSKEMPLSKPLTKKEYDKQDSYYKYGGGDYSSFQAWFDLNPDVTNYLFFEAVDVFGRKSKESIQLNVKSGAEGSMYPWSVSLDKDEHSFKPYRLKDGNELLTFKLKLDWIGIGEEPQVTGVTIKPRKRTLEMVEGRNSESYKCFIEGEIFPARPKVTMFDDNKTYWYIMYKLKPWKDINDSLHEEWHDLFKKLVNSDCKLPLKAEIVYSYRDINGTMVSGQEQEFWFDQTNFIESQVNPKAVIPENLLEAGLKSINVSLATLKAINKYFIKPLNIAARASCYTLLAGYSIKKIKTRIRCGRISKKESDSDAELKEKIAKCAEDIQELKILYNKYRLACDRVWCKSAPRDPGTGETKKGLTITVGDGPKNGKCNDDKDYICVEGPSLFDYYCGTPYPNHYETTDCPQINEGTEQHQLCCRKRGQGELEKVDMIKDEQDTFNPPSEKDDWWDGIDELSKKYLFGRRQVAVSEEDKTWNFGLWAGYGAETTEDLFKGEYYGAAGYTAAQKAKKSIIDEFKGSDSSTEHSYDTYVSGIHGPSCFNGEPVFDKDRLYLTPSQNFMDSVQCGCISDIYGRLQQTITVLEHLQQCMTQIKETGEAKAGACKQLFTKFVCDLLTWVLLKATMGIVDRLDTGSKAQEKTQDKIPMGSAITIGFKEAIGSFKDDYGGSIRLGLDFSMEYMTHSVCMAAFGNEWPPGLRGVFGFQEGGPPRQSSAIILPAEREILGANPITGTATYEYRLGVSVSAGSNLRYYKVELICDMEGDCTGQPQSILFKSSPEIPAGRVTEGLGINQFSSVGGSMYLDNKEFRYNKVRVCWVSEAGEQYSGCEEREIKGTIDDFKLFDCDITPGAGIGGNDIIQCGLLQTNTYAEFVRFPPATHTVTIPTDNYMIDIPFSVKGVYESIEDEVRPLLLGIEEVSYAGTSLGATYVIPAQAIRSGTSISTDFQRPVARTTWFRRGLSTTEVSGKSEMCKKAEIVEGPVTTEATIIVTFEKEPLEEKNIYVSNIYGLAATGNKCGEGITSCCNGEACKFKNNVLTLNIEGATVRLGGLGSLRPKKGDTCTVRVVAGGESVQQITRTYKIGIYQNNGENGLGAITKRAGKDQSQLVKVIMSAGTEADIKKGTTAAADRVEFSSVFSLYKIPANNQRYLQGIQVKGANYIRYRIENEAGKIVQEAKEISPIPEYPGFNISGPEGKGLPEGVYSLIVQAGDIKAKEISQIQRQEYILNVGKGIQKLSAPKNLRTNYNPDSGKLEVYWDKLQNVDYDVYFYDSLGNELDKIIDEKPLIAAIDVPKDQTGKQIKVKVIAKAAVAEATKWGLGADAVSSDPAEIISETIPEAEEKLEAPDISVSYNSEKNEFHIKWTPVYGPDSYNIEYGKTGDTKKVIAAKAEDKEKSLSGIEKGAEYEFEVTYIKNGKVSAAAVVNEKASETSSELTPDPTD